MVCGFHQQSEIYVDLDEIEGDIASLQQSKAEFIEILSRKLRVHRNIFSQERTNALIPIGPFIGLFSWISANNVTCHKILTVRIDASPDFVDRWMTSCVQFNDAKLQSYRNPDTQPADPKNKHLLKKALKEYADLAGSLFSAFGLDECGMALLGNGYVASRAAVRTYLGQAKTMLEVDNLVGAVGHLESALSGMHDVIDGLSKHLTTEVGSSK